MKRDIVSFNPTLVRLRRVRLLSRGGPKLAFNPTLVRLRPMMTRALWSVFEFFQSHLGSIAALPM